MASRSALLVAIVAVLAGGAFLLGRSLEKRAADAAHEAAADRPSSASADGPATLTVPPVAGPTARANLGGDAVAVPESNAAVAATRVRVHVIRSRTAAPAVPVANARVEIIDTGEDDGRPRWDVKAKGETDENGVFTFDAPKSFLATMRAEALIDGRRHEGSASGHLPQHLNGPFYLYLSEQPHREVHATVLDRDTLAPIVGADVRPSLGFPPTTTNALGEFTVVITGDTGTEVSAWIGAAGYFPATWRSAPTPGSFGVGRRREGPSQFFTTAPESNALVCLQRSARLQGVVLDAGGGRVEGAELRIYAFPLGNGTRYGARQVSAVSDKEGRFAFELLPAGIALHVELRLRGESVQSDLDEFVLEPGESREVSLRVRGHVELTGRVFDENDKLVRGGTIAIDIDGKPEQGSIRTDGTYYLPFAVAGTRWILVAREPLEGSTPRVVSVPIVIPPRVAEWTFDVHLVPQSAIAGVLLDSDGRAVRGGRLSLSAQRTSMFERRVEDDRGSFLFEAVPAGEYRLTGQETDGARRTVSAIVRAGDRSVVLRLPEQGTLRGRVVRPGGEACTSALVHVGADAVPDFTIRCANDGTFRFPATLGATWIRAESGGAHSRFERVTVKAARETAVSDLVVVPSAELRFMTGRHESNAHVAVSDDTGPYFEFDLEPMSERALRVPAGALKVVVTCAGSTTTRALVPERGTALDVPIVCGP